MTQFLHKALLILAGWVLGFETVLVIGKRLNGYPLFPDLVFVAVAIGLILFVWKGAFTNG